MRSLRNLDVQRTIRKNLAHYDTQAQRLVLEQIYFNGRIKRYNPWRVVLAVDESGSMLSSVIHSAVMAGIFAKLPMLDTRLVIFDTSVVDLSGYVVKEEGKGLSSNDYTDEEKAKLAGLEILGTDHVTGVRDKNGEEIPCQGVFLLRASIAPAQLAPGLALEGGYIKVDGRMATNLPGVFAAGDCTGGPLQVSKAVGEGHVAALSACAYLDRETSRITTTEGEKT